MMKINKIREMSSPDLEKELGELKTELFKLKFSLATNGLDNQMKIKEVKRDIAKINTVNNIFASLFFILSRCFLISRIYIARC